MLRMFLENVLKHLMYLLVNIRTTKSAVNRNI